MRIKMSPPLLNLSLLFFLSPAIAVKKLEIMMLFSKL
jgi:hypothetical protein